MLLLALGTFALGLDAYVLAGLLPGISASFGTSEAAAGQVVTGFTLSYALLSPALVVFAGRMDRRRLLLTALGIFVLGNIASVLSPTLWILIGTRCVVGAGAGLYSASAAAAAAQLVSPDQRGRALSLVLGGLTFATIIGVPAGVLLGVHVDWRATLLLVAALAVLAGLGIARYLPPIHLPPPPSLRERLTVLGYGRVRSRVAIMLILGVANLGLYTYLATILNRISGISPASLPIYLFVWGAGGAVGNIAVGRFLDRGRKPGVLLATAIILLAAGLFLLPLGSSHPALIVGLLFVWGAAAWSLQVPLQYELASTVPDQAATAISLLASSVYLGSTIGAALDGVLLTLFGAQILPIVAGLLASLALLLHGATHRSAS